MPLFQLNKVFDFMKLKSRTTDTVPWVNLNHKGETGESSCHGCFNGRLPYYTLSTVIYETLSG